MEIRCILVPWAESGGLTGARMSFPNSNDIVDSHLTRDYPLNGGLRPPANGRLVHANPVITGLEFTSKLHPL